MIMIMLVTKLAKTIVMIGIVVFGSIVTNCWSLSENQANLCGRFLYTPTIIIALINTVSGGIFI